MSTSTATPATQVLPPDLVDSINRQCKATIVEVIPRAGGGASRSSAQVVLRRDDGSLIHGYLSLDDRVGDATRLQRYERECAILAALSGPLGDRGVRVPRFLASEPTHLALLTELVPGDGRFTSIKQAEERDCIAQDFMRQLVALHAIDVRGAGLPAFGDPEMPTSARILDRLAQLRQRNLSAIPDPILLLAIDWAERNVPPDNGPSVIVHGDAGPGNFMHQSGKLTALVDWEMCHLGDAAEDLAQIWVRSLFQPFVAPRVMLDHYASAGGRPLDVARVRYHRLLFQLSFTVDRQASMDGFGAPPGNIGNNMLYHTIHMRVIVQQLAELSGTVLPPVTLPDVAEAPTTRAFDVALADLRDIIVPRATDEQASVKAKSLARMLKFWRMRDRYGASFDRLEIDEIGQHLGTGFTSLAEARRALAQAILKRTIGWDAALALCHARVMCETELMGDALGSLKHTYFAPLK